MHQKAAAASELERRKQVRLRLREDLAISAQKYEGRTYWVVKDPVSLRYYRFKEQEHFLLGYMDGRHTLDEAQKEFEKVFRPDRLTLEDLESFAQQLLTAGLAQNESPKAGKQLFDRRKKRKRSEWVQALTNILYIKIPIFDPDRLLKRMLVYLSWIFTFWFMFGSLAIMSFAIVLVASHFDIFREKMPAFHEFFRFKNLILLWISLGIVKVIHEFGHGLSCKAFGGEVHEMGALFLCFSPCLYCNVSDAWTLPSKWKRIIISAAGIWVELVIAAIATIVWWNSTNPDIKNISMNLMILCSISTIFFNANPLMRYDGYYVLADWLEVPNLRDRSNRFLKNLILEFCLGVEVQPEPYMATWRKTLFVLFAIVSYIYRWVVTFTILYFMYNWLRPYKLGVISSILAMFAAGSMVGWPLFRLGKAIHKRGRLPDMKRGRAIISSAAVACVLLFLFLVPLPIGRVKEIGAVEFDRDASIPVAVQTPGRLEACYVNNGDVVTSGFILAVFSNPDLEADLIRARSDAAVMRNKVDDLRRSEGEQRTASGRQIGPQITEAQHRLEMAQKDVQLKEKEVENLKLKAPRGGVVLSPPMIGDIGKYWDPAHGEGKHFCKIGEPLRLRVIVPVSPHHYKLLQEDMADAEARGNDLMATIRIQGLASHTWDGKVLPLPMSAAGEGDIPPQLTTKYGGPVTVKPGSHPERPDLVAPQSQQYLVEIEILNPDTTISPGALAQVKVHGRWHTTAWWVWYKLSDLFDIGLL